jgi:PAS domain-containing protein
VEDAGMNTFPQGDEIRSSQALDAVGRRSLAAAVEHAGDGIAVTDSHGIITCVNPSFPAMTGYRHLPVTCIEIHDMADKAEVEGHVHNGRDDSADCR